jgi:hypothetical protein
MTVKGGGFCGQTLDELHETGNYRPSGRNRTCVVDNTGACQKRMDDRLADDKACG